MKKIDLTKIFDKSVWISDDRIAVLISSECKGIAQIDYHGKQPVSRNARILLDTSGVFRFIVIVTQNGRKYKKEISFDKICWAPEKIKTRLNINKIDFELNILVSSKSLIIYLESNNSNVYPVSVDLEIILENKSKTSEVHGIRTWKESGLGKNYICFCVNDRIIINEWLKRTGPYQGDFLIPENIRRKIYKTNKLSGQATYDNLKDQYKFKKSDLYNTYVHLLMGGKDVKIRKEEEQTVFVSNKKIRPKQSGIFNRFIIVFGDSNSEVKDNFTYLVKNGNKYFQNKEVIQEKEKRVLPKINLEGPSKISDFFDTVPGIIESAEVKEYKMIRACASSYYWFWAWDSMVTARILSMWNNLELQRGIIDFIGFHRDIDGAIPQQWSRLLEPMDNRGFGVHDFLFANLIFNYYCGTSDISIIEDNYSQLVNSFNQIYNSCNKNGIYSTIGMYPDLPLKLGRKNDGFTAMEEASLFSFSILVQNAAYLMHDSAVIESTNSLIEKLKNNFLKLFFDKQKKFIVDSIDKDFRQNKTYPLYSLLFLLYPSGISLIREKLMDLSKFILDNYFEENGIALFPEWDKNRLSETTTSAWYPFWDILTIKVLRRTNNIKAIKRWLGLVSRCYKYFGFCPEYISLNQQNIKGKNWKSRGTPWNLNCAAGWYQSIIEGIYGIEEDIGGITYIPAEPINKKQKLSGIYFRGIKTDLEISGNGRYVKNIIVNGVLQKGLLKIPMKYFETEKLKLKINHCHEMPDLMINEINGGSVLDFHYTEHKIDLEFEGFGYVEIVFTSKLKPAMMIDNVKINYTWDRKHSTGHLFSFLPGKHSLKIPKIKY